MVLEVSRSRKGEYGEEHGYGRADVGNVLIKIEMFVKNDTK